MSHSKDKKLVNILYSVIIVLLIIIAIWSFYLGKAVTLNNIQSNWIIQTNSTQSRFDAYENETILNKGPFYHKC